MFSGIVEAKANVIKFIPRDRVFELVIACPEIFQDLSIGDSIAVNGVCLTVEAFSKTELQFAVAKETLEITSWTEEFLKSKPVNLERSLRMGDRIHGHVVTGHVDAVAEIKKTELWGESLLLDISVPLTIEPYVWKKGSVALNGVSLTVNDIEGKILKVCLIPETLKRTNLGSLKTGNVINVEVDFMARGLLRSMELKRKTQL